jgi:hypothetical protein
LPFFTILSANFSSRVDRGERKTNAYVHSF